MNRHQLMLLAGGVLLVLLLYVVWEVFIIFVLSFFVAYLLHPEVRWIEERVPLGRLPVVILLSAGIALILLLLAILLTSQLYDFYLQLRQLSQDAPAIQEKLDRFLPEDWTRRLADYIEELRRGGIINEIIESIQTHSTSAIAALQQGWVYLGVVLGQTYGFVQVLINLVVFAFVAIYLLRDFEKFVENVRSLIPLRYRETAEGLIGEIDQTLKAFVRGHATVCVIIGVLYGLGYMLVGLSGGFVIGLFGGLINVIPYLGPTLGFGVAAVMAVYQFGFGVQLLGVILVFTLVQSLEGNILTPRIVGGAVGLHPVSAILALMIFGQFMGFLGLLIALPVAAIFKILLRHLVSWYRESDFFRAGDESAG